MLLGGVSDIHAFHGLADGLAERCRSRLRSPHAAMNRSAGTDDEVVSRLVGKEIY